VNAAEVAQALHGKPAAGGWLARCPAHDDQRASLKIDAGDGGRVLVKCHAQCSVDAITAAVGMTARDLFPESPSPSVKPRIIATYQYRDEQDAHLYDVLRFEPKDFRQRKADGTPTLNGTQRVVYRLPNFAGKSAVFIVEGEKDVERLWSNGIPATCNSGGAGKWRDEYSAQLASLGIKRVIVISDVSAASAGDRREGTADPAVDAERSRCRVDCPRTEGPREQLSLTQEKRRGQSHVSESPPHATSHRRPAASRQ
jgi:hypothetical protein